MITISEIARLAKVSRGTVDRVIHNRGRVSKEKEARVRKILKEIGYKPNIYARGLSLSKTLCFGVLIPDVSNNVFYWSLPVKGINKASEELHGYRVKIKYFYYDNYPENSFQKACNEIIKNVNELDGLLIAPSSSEIVRQFVSNLPAQLPYVYIDTYVPHTNYLTFISPNSFQGGRLAARLMHLLFSGGATIAILRELPYKYHIINRIKGFQSYFKNFHDVKINVYDVDRREDTQILSKKVADLYENVSDFKGVFLPTSTSNEVADYIAANSLNGKIHVIGYDLIDKNIEHLRKGTIDFLISQRPETQGYQAVYALFKHVALKEKIAKRILIPIDIVTKENVYPRNSNF